VQEKLSQHQWLTSVILATQEAEMRISAGSQLRQIETLSQKNPSQKWAGGVTQGVGLEFKTSNNNNKKRIIARHWWLMPVILATQEDHGLNPTRANSLRDPYLKNTQH
jgi:hypothetical protein